MQHGVAALIDDPKAVFAATQPVLSLLLDAATAPTPGAAWQTFSQDVHRAITQDAQTYWYEQGMYNSGTVGSNTPLGGGSGIVPMLMGAVAFKRNGDFGAGGWGVTFSNPFDTYAQHFQAAMQTPGATPEMAALAAAESVHSKLGSFLWAMNPLNPAYSWITFPGAERLVSEIFGAPTHSTEAFAANVRAVTNEGADRITSGTFDEAQRLIEQGGTLTRTSAAELTAEAMLHPLDALGVTTDVTKGRLLYDLAAQIVDSLNNRAMDALANPLMPEIKQRAADIGQQLGLSASATWSYAGHIADSYVERYGVKGAMEQIGKVSLEEYTNAGVRQIAYRAGVSPTQVGADAIARQQIGKQIEADLKDYFYRLAGAPIPSEQGLLRQAINGGIKVVTDTLRTLFLINAAPALAIQKIVDEAVRAATEGVLPYHLPAQFATTAALGRFASERGGTGPLGRAGDAIAGNRVINRHIDNGLRVPDQLLRDARGNGLLQAARGTDIYGEQMGGMARLRAANPVAAFDRLLDKFLHATIQSPTQHIILAAANRDLVERMGGLANVKEGLAQRILAQIPDSTDALSYAEAIRAARSMGEFKVIYDEVAQKYGPLTTAPGVSTRPRGAIGEAGPPPRPDVYGQSALYDLDNPPPPQPGATYNQSPLFRDLPPQAPPTNGHAPLPEEPLQTVAMNGAKANGAMKLPPLGRPLRPAEKLAVANQGIEDNPERYIAAVRGRLDSLPPEVRNYALNNYRNTLHKSFDPLDQTALRLLDENAIRVPYAATDDALAREVGARQGLGRDFDPGAFSMPTAHLAPGTDVGASLRPFEAPRGAEQMGYDSPLGYAGAPRVAPDDALAATWYHGSGTAGLTPEQLFHGNTQANNLYGRGLYFTDNPDIAREYAQQYGEQGVVYGSRLNARKTLDLEVPATPQIREAATSAAYDNAIGPPVEQWLAEHPHATTAEIYDAIRDILLPHAYEAGFARPGAVFDAFDARLVGDLGYDTFQHTGGLRIGATQHKVLIVPRPGEGGVIRNFSPIGYPDAPPSFAQGRFPEQRALFGEQGTYTDLRGPRAAPIGNAGAPGEPLLLGAGAPGQSPYVNRTKMAGRDALLADIQGTGQQYRAGLLDAQRAGLERGYRIVGNPADQTKLGAAFKQGVQTPQSWGPVGGITILPAILPFAPFHIHSTQFWLREFASHPYMPVAMLAALKQAGIDDYGNYGLADGGTVGGLTKMTTAGHLMDWGLKAYQYFQDVRANPNGNSGAQQALKNVAYNTVGNNAFVGPFGTYRGVGSGLVAGATEPLLTPKGKTDNRDVMAERGSETWMEGGLNLAGVPRGLSHAVGQAGNLSSNVGQSVGANAAGLLGGDATIKGYEIEKQLPYFAGDYADANNWSRARTRTALQNPDSPDGRALYAAFDRRNDMTGLSKAAPLRFTSPDSGLPVYPDSLPHSDFRPPKSEWVGSDRFRLDQQKTAQEMLYGRGQSQYEIEQEIARQFPNLSPAQRKAIEYKALDSAGAHPSDPRMQAAAKVMLDNGAWEYNPNAPETQQKAERAAGRLKEAEYIAAHASPYPTDDMHRLGEGGMAGQQFPDGYGWESRDAAAANTARSQLFQPDFATSDYARDYLQHTGGAGLVGVGDQMMNGQPSEQRTTRAEQRLVREIDQNTITTGTYLNAADRAKLQDYENAKVAYEGRPTKARDGTEATVKELLARPGNYNETIGKAVAAQDAGDKDLAQRLFDAADQMKHQSPEVTDYFNALATAGQRDDKKRLDLRRDDALLANPATAQETGFAPRNQDSVKDDRLYFDQWNQKQRDAYDAFNDLRASKDYKARTALENAIPDKATDPKGYSAWFKEHGEELYRLNLTVYQAEQAILSKTGDNPKQIANEMAQAKGYAPTYADTTIKAPTPFVEYPTTATSTKPSSGARGTSGTTRASSRSYSPPRGSGAGGSAAGAKTAGDDFFTAYRDLTPTEKQLVRKDKEVAAVLVSGVKHTEQQYTAALERLKSTIEKSKGFAANPAASEFRYTPTRWTGSGPGLTPDQLARGVDSIDLQGREKVIPGFAQRMALERAVRPGEARDASNPSTEASQPFTARTAASTQPLGYSGAPKAKAPTASTYTSNYGKQTNRRGR
jgi:hypothetical protein